MVIKLYINTSDPKTVDKTLTGEISINGVARDPADVVNPVIEYEKGSTDISGYNYAYIEDFARYYFMEVTCDSYNMYTLTLHCDVLSTAKAWLRARPATLTRNEKTYNAYLNDENFKAYAYKNIVTKAFPSGITGDSIILMTVG